MERENSGCQTKIWVVGLTNRFKDMEESICILNKENENVITQPKKLLNV